MKKVIFGLVAIAFISFTGNAQKMSNDQIRTEYAKGMISFVESVRPVYTAGMSFKDFKSKLSVDDTDLTPEGSQLLLSSYTFLANKTSQREILEKGDVRPLMNASLFVINYNKDRGTNVGEQILFGIENSTYLPAGEKARKCKWYQIGCHLSNIFNWIVENAETITSVLITYCQLFRC
ncbi:MAG: hypothetical protein ITG00_00190 [Flavobacterium sp.]|nr:hypothetical protein [Flavobacterium sp.]